MTVNTAQLGDGQYVTTSSISITGGPSRSTLKAEDLVGTSTLSTAALTVATLVATSTASIGGATTQTGALTTNSTISAVGQVSVGNFQVNSKATFAGAIISSATTNQSASTAKVLAGQLIFSILSLTTNGAALFYRSGNSTFVFESSGVIG